MSPDELAAIVARDARYPENDTFVEAVEDRRALLALLRETREVVDRSKRLQSAHHRMLRVTAVTCDACKAERARLSPDRPTPP